MIPWLREKPALNGVRLRVGGYLPPFRARAFLMALTLVTFVIGLWLAFALLANDKAAIAIFRNAGIPVCLYYVLCLIPLFTPCAFVFTPLGQMLGEILIGSRFTVVVTRDYVQVIRWLVYRPKYPIGAGIFFERLPHPKAQAEITGNELRRAEHPKNPAKAMQFNEYQRSQVVVLRSGKNAIRLASIYDRKPVGLGHKAEVLVKTLQQVYSQSRTGNRSADRTQTPLQYGQRPSMN